MSLRFIIEDVSQHMKEGSKLDAKPICRSAVNHAERPRKNGVKQTGFSLPQTTTGKSVSVLPYRSPITE